MEGEEEGGEGGDVAAAVAEWWEGEEGGAEGVEEFGLEGGVGLGGGEVDAGGGEEMGAGVRAGEVGGEGLLNRGREEVDVVEEDGAA